MLSIRPATLRPPPTIARIAGLSPVRPTRVGLGPLLAEFAPLAIPDAHLLIDALRPSRLVLRIPEAAVMWDDRVHSMPLIFAAMLAWVVLPIGGGGVSRFLLWDLDRPRSSYFATFFFSFDRFFGLQGGRSEDESD